MAFLVEMELWTMEHKWINHVSTNIDHELESVTFIKSQVGWAKQQSIIIRKWHLQIALAESEGKLLEQSPDVHVIQQCWIM